MILLPEIYLDLRYYRRYLKGRPRRRLACWLPTAVMLYYTVEMARLKTFAPADIIWLKIYLACIVFFVVPKFIATGCSFLGYLARRLFHLRVNYGNPIGLLLSFIAVLCYFYGSIFGVRQLRVSHVDLAFTDLPAAFDGYKIVQFSDAHMGSFGKSDRKLVQRDIDSINAQKPDLIAFTGDIQDIRPSELNPWTDVLSQLHARDGVFSVLGNHDYSFYVTATPAEKKRLEAQVRAHERQFGWQLLLNEHRILRRGTDSLVIAGEENDGMKDFDQRADLGKTLRGLRPDAFVVLLQHTPAAWRQDILPHSKVQLTLSGHTHGGQMSLFGIRPTLFRGTEDLGLYQEGERSLYVTAGIGGLVPFRFNMPAEITVITLHRK